MLKNYFKIAFRNIWRNSVFSLINIVGLALGLTCSLLILLWVNDELSFDKFHKNNDRIYRVMANVNWGTLTTFPVTPSPLAEAIKKEIPEVEAVVRMTEFDYSELFIVGDKSFKEVKGRFATNSLFKIFSFPLISGDSKTALNDPSSIVISEALAKKYFGNEDPINKIIKISNVGNVRVSGVMKDIPSQSSLQFDFVLPYDIFLKRNASWIDQWGSFNISTYILLKEGSSVVSVEKKIQKVVLENDKGTKNQFFLYPLKNVYLYSKFEDGKQAGGKIEYIRIFTIVAIFILLIACVNFMNLSTARAGKRTKEIGVRKVSGATRLSLIFQFVGEAFILTLFSLLIAVVLVELALPTFNEITGKYIFIFYEFRFGVALLILAFITAVIAGSYPAFFMSSLKPVIVLKGALKFNLRAILLRKGLVVFQFSLSILLIIGTIIIYDQIAFIRNKNLGFNKENLMSIPVEGDLWKNRDLFKQEALKSSSIKSMTLFSSNPMEVNGTSGDLNWEGKPANSIVSVAALFVGYDFLKTLDIKVKEGRDFSPSFGTDSLAYIINEAAVKLMKMKDPLGKEITFWNGQGKIIGVLPDFHLESMHQEIKPLVLMLDPRNAANFIVRTKAGKNKEAIATLQNLAKKYNPGFPFEFKFFDESIEKLYQGEKLVEQLSKYASFMAICISCMGLFGLALLTVQQKNKEITIRKVIGAKIIDIVNLLSKDFLKLVLISNLIAWPLGWYFMNKWLQNYAFRIDIEWWVFVLAMVLATFVAFLTIVIQTVKAAIANPVKSLRSE